MGGVHARDWVRIIERCKPLDACEWVRKCAELRGKTENYANLRRRKT
jgi:hypothetical protein